MERSGELWKPPDLLALLRAAATEAADVAEGKVGGEWRGEGGGRREEGGGYQRKAHGQMSRSKASQAEPERRP